MTYEISETILLNLFCVAIIVIELVSALINRNKHDRTVLTFGNVCVATIFFLFMNLATDLTDGYEDLAWLSFAGNMLTYIAIDMAVLAFAGYLKSLLDTGKKKRLLFIYIAEAVAHLRILITLILGLTGNLFTIENGYYTEQPLMMIPYCVSIANLVILAIGVHLNKEHFSRKHFTVIMLYVIMPIIPVVIEAFYPLYNLTSAALTISVLLIYIMIQSSRIDDSKMREAVLKELSYTDLLTGLLNRRSYYDRLNKLSKEEPLGILFCDINGLKYTNDHFGHATGDDLIKRFAEILLTSFRKEDIYRISGDEFVVLIPDTPQNLFSVRADKFIRKIHDSENIAAAGYAYGSGCCAEKLIAEAEKNMYEDKRLNGSGRGDPV